MIFFLKHASKNSYGANLKSSRTYQFKVLDLETSPFDRSSHNRKQPRWLRLLPVRPAREAAHGRLWRFPSHPSQTQRLTSFPRQRIPLPLHLLQSPSNPTTQLLCRFSLLLTIWYFTLDRIRLGKRWRGRPPLRRDRRTSPPGVRLPQHRGPRPRIRAPHSGCHCTDIDPVKRLPVERSSLLDNEATESGTACSFLQVLPGMWRILCTRVLCVPRGGWMAIGIVVKRRAASHLFSDDRWSWLRGKVRGECGGAPLSTRKHPALLWCFLRPDKYSDGAVLMTFFPCSDMHTGDGRAGVVWPSLVEPELPRDLVMSSMHILQGAFVWMAWPIVLHTFVVCTVCACLGTIQVCYTPSVPKCRSLGLLFRPGEKLTIDLNTLPSKFESGSIVFHLRLRPPPPPPPSTSTDPHLSPPPQSPPPTSHTPST